MISLTAFSCIMEMITFIIDGKALPGMRELHMIGDTLLFLANITISFSWCIYVDLRLYEDEQRLKKYTWKAIPALIAVLSVILNLKFEFLFTIDEKFYYHRCPAGYTHYLITFGYLTYSLLIRRRYYKEHGKIRFFPIYMFITPIYVGATVQFFIYGVSLAWCCTALGLTGMYMSLQNELSYIDPLTKLYNRNYLDYTINDISRKNTPSGGIMIDLDYFKNINDTFGHSVGDEALIDAADLIRKAVPSYGVPVRFAGDEFVIILRTSEEDKIIEIVDKLRKAVKNYNQSSQKPYQLSFSIGYSIYHSEATADIFLNEMDENMYEEKRRKHSRSAKKSKPA